MPVYEYECPKCGTQIELDYILDEAFPCGECGTPLLRVYSAAAVHWYGGKPSAGEVKE